MYTAVRISSVLAKAAQMNFKPGKILPPATDTERDLMLSLTGVSDNLLRAFADRLPTSIDPCLKYPLFSTILR